MAGFDPGFPPRGYVSVGAGDPGRGDGLGPRGVTRRHSPAATLLVGAMAYALLVGGVGVTFDATPLLVGLVALAAAVLGHSTRMVATGLALAGWGAAVLLVRHGPLPDDREAVAFLVGAGAGLVVARVIARARPDLQLGDGSVALVAGGIAFYLAFDATWIDDWPLWTAVMVGWAAWEARQTGRARAGP